MDSPSCERGNQKFGLKGLHLMVRVYQARSQISAGRSYASTSSIPNRKPERRERSGVARYDTEAYEIEDPEP